jgi:hypothetical protein
MHTSQGLQENDTEPETLDRIQHTQPEPDTAGRESSSGIAAGDPGEVVADSGDTPPDLGPAGGAQAAGEDGEEPTVGFEVAADDE